MVTCKVKFVVQANDGRPLSGLEMNINGDNFRTDASGEVIMKTHLGNQLMFATATEAWIGSGVSRVRTRNLISISQNMNVVRKQMLVTLAPESGYYQIDGLSFEQPLS